MGSGEALNEQIVGGPWPEKAERNAKLQEAVEIIRSLWTGERLTHSGRFEVREAKLFTLPRRPIRLIGAALSPATARWCGAWVDGLITVSGPSASVKAVLEAFEAGGGRGKPRFVQVGLCWAGTEAQARREAHQRWRHAGLGKEALDQIATPRAMDEATAQVSEEDVANSLHVSADLEQYIAWLKQYMELGFDGLFLQQLGQDMPGFIRAFGNQVLPVLKAHVQG